MMTRKNQVDDLLTRFERKPINQKKCPYCHHGEQGFIKPLIRYTGETGDMGEMDYHEVALDIEHNQLYIQGDVPNLGEYCFETNINYCPKCGRELAKNEIKGSKINDDWNKVVNDWRKVIHGG